MFDVGAAGSTILFMMFGVGQILISWLVLSYASHCFLVVVQETAAGTDEVVWPDEPMYDWIWKLWYLLWLSGSWLLLVGFLLWSIDLPAFHEYRWLRGLILGGVFWLTFPVSLFSSLSTHSRWVLFRPAVLGWLLRKFFSTTAFYILSALLLVSLGILLGLPLAYRRPLVLPVVCALASAFVLVYARLVGRMAGILNRMIESTREPDPPVQESSATPEQHRERVVTPPRSKKGRRTRVKSYDPWATSEDPVPPDPGLPRHLKPGDVYGIQDKGKRRSKPPPAPPSGPRRVWVEDGADEPYELQPMPAKPNRPAEANPEAVSEYELRLARHDPAPTPPPLPLVNGVVGFLFYGSTLQPLAFLACGGGIMGLFLYMQILTSPF